VLATLPDPVYGRQLQPFAVPGLPAEGRLRIDYTEVPVALNGGETVVLMRPRYAIENLGYGPMHPDLTLSPRLAPPMLGLGLLEAIHPDDIVAHAAQDHGDGVLGSPNWVRDTRTGEKVLGRFNWKAGQPDVLLHDMGEGLADGQPEGEANGREWRTPPLWGIGLTPIVNPNATWLHDGRARTLLEAVLWHGGQAQAARDRVVAMTPAERADLIRFLESL